MALAIGALVTTTAAAQSAGIRPPGTSSGIATAHGVPGGGAAAAMQVLDLPLSTARIVVLCVLGVASLVFLGLFVASVLLGNAPRMDSHWGGLGGGLGGWQVSPSLAFLCAGLLLSAFTSSAATSEGPASAGRSSPASAEAPGAMGTGIPAR
jgi:hypothetical protein